MIVSTFHNTRPQFFALLKTRGTTPPYTPEINKHQTTKTRINHEFRQGKTRRHQLLAYTKYRRVERSASPTAKR